MGLLPQKPGHRVKTINRLQNSLKNDKISIVATDTTLGFIANSKFKSFNTLNEIKGKRPNKPYLLLIWPKTKLNKFVTTDTLTPKQRNLLEKCWPGPVTIIFKAKKNIPQFLKSKEGTIAIRCPRHKYLQKLLESFNGLFSTSANKTNDPIPKDANSIDIDVLNKIKHLVVDTNHLLYKILPSSIIDVSNRNVVKVVREGAFPIKKLEEFYGAKFKKNKGLF